MAATAIRARAAAFATAGLALSLLACGGSPARTEPRTAALPLVHPARTRTTGARVALLAPSAHAQLGSTVRARVTITGFKLSSRQGGPARPGVGHLQFVFDRGRYDQPQYSGAAGCESVRQGVNGRYSIASRPTITYRHIPPGPHVLRVLLANTDQTAAGASAQVRFRTAGGARSEPPRAKCFPPAGGHQRTRGGRPRHG